MTFISFHLCWRPIVIWRLLGCSAEESDQGQCSKVQRLNSKNTTVLLGKESTEEQENKLQSEKDVYLSSDNTIERRCRI